MVRFFSVCQLYIVITSQIHPSERKYKLNIELAVSGSVIIACYHITFHNSKIFCYPKSVLNHSCCFQLTFPPYVVPANGIFPRDWQEFIIPEIRASRVKLTIKSVYTQLNNGFYEIEVYGTPEGNSLKEFTYLFNQ